MAGPHLPAGHGLQAVALHLDDPVVPQRQAKGGRIRAILQEVQVHGHPAGRQRRVALRQGSLADTGGSRPKEVRR